MNYTLLKNMMARGLIELGVQFLICVKEVYFEDSTLKRRSKPASKKKKRKNIVKEVS